MLHQLGKLREMLRMIRGLEHGITEAGAIPIRLQLHQGVLAGQNFQL